MNFALLTVAFLATLNPARVRLGLPADETGRARPRALAVGVAATFALAALGVALADSLLDVLEVSPETFRIAAGFVMAVAGAWVIWFPERPAEPELPGAWAGLVPIAFPLLISPELFVLTLATGADEPAGGVLGALAIALAALYGSGAVPPRGPGRPLLRAVSRLLAAVMIVVALALVIDGIRDI